ncbi:MAG: FecR domain-containing protein [Acidobacteria bacterium]|nr:FecR domain-containing protein [Acidobacteriota bacterium]
MKPQFPMLNRTLAALAGALFLVSLPAAAQRQAYSYISYAGGDVALISSADDDSTARVNTPVLAGDRIETSQSSRAELVLADGNILSVDIRTAIRFDRLARSYETDDLRNLLFLERGALVFESRYTPAADEATRIDTDDATVVIPDTGLVRIDAGRKGSEIYVAAGRAEVMSRRTRAVVRAGEYAYVTTQDEIEVDRWDFPRDRFTRFVEERRDRYQSAPQVQTASYVSPEYDYDYSVSGLGDYGSWVYVADYGQHCWRPSVGSDWRPYSNGSWRYTPAGLHWVSYEPWGWLPHHYGSWAFTASFGWCWLPGRAYSPAWVYWSYTPGYVGWCPMGYYSHYSHYYRAGRGWYGHEGHHRGAYPHFNGRIDVSHIDRNGWNFVSNHRIGGRLDSRDIIRGDRLDVRPGMTGVVSTAPLRVDNVRRGTASSAIQDAVRRAGTVPGPGTAVGANPSPDRVDQNLTALLRREPNLPPAASQTLRQSFVRTGYDPAYKPIPAEAISSGQRVEAPTVVSRSGSSKPAAPMGASLESRDVISRRGETGSQGSRTVPGTGELRSGTSSSGRVNDTTLRDSWRDSSGTSRRQVPLESGSPNVVSRESSQTGRRDTPPLTRETSSSTAPGRIGVDESWRSGDVNGRQLSPQVGTSSRRELGTASQGGTDLRTRQGGSTSLAPRVDDGWRSTGEVRIGSPRNLETRPEVPSSQPYESRGSSGGGVTLPPRDDSRSSTPGRTIESSPRREAPPAAPAPRTDSPVSNPRISESWRSGSQGYEVHVPRQDASSSGSRMDSPRIDSSTRYGGSRPSEVSGNSAPAYEAPRREVSQPRSYESPRSYQAPRAPEAPRSMSPPSSGYSAPSGGYSAPSSGRSAPSGGYSAPSHGSTGGMSRMESRPAPSSSSGRSESSGSSGSRPSGPKRD